MAGIVKTEWFGTQVTVLMVNGKSVTGELSETSENYIVLTRGASPIQIMAGAIVMIVPAAEKGKQSQAKPADDSGPALFE